MLIVKLMPNGVFNMLACVAGAGTEVAGERENGRARGRHARGLSTCKTSLFNESLVNVKGLSNDDNNDGVFTLFQNSPL